MSKSSLHHQQTPTFTQRQLKVIGLFLGIAAADRNGGPQRMLCRVAESLLQNKAFHREDIALRYYSWMFPKSTIVEKKLMITETESAFDTGTVFSSVFSQIHGELVDVSSSPSSATTTLMTIDNSIIDKNASSFYKSYQSAGANPCHRNSVLGLACPKSMIKNYSELARAAASETTITHLHPEAVDTSIAVSIICRKLIEMSKSVRDDDGFSAMNQLKEAISVAIPFVKEDLVLEVLKNFPYENAKNVRAEHHTGGHSPLVLKSALYFLARATTFEEALFPSLAFAGPANFCPVLVGSIGGCIFGVDEEKVLKKIMSNSFELPKRSDVEDEDQGISSGVTLESLRHRYVSMNGFLKRHLTVAIQFTEFWQE